MVIIGNKEEKGFHAVHKKGGAYSKKVGDDNVSFGAILYQDTASGPIYTYTDAECKHKLMIYPPEVSKLDVAKHTAAKDDMAQIQHEIETDTLAFSKSTKTQARLQELEPIFSDWEGKTNPGNLIQKAYNFGYGGAILIRGKPGSKDKRSYAFAKTSAAGNFSLQEFHNGSEYKLLDRGPSNFDASVYETHSEVAVNPFLKMETNFGDDVARTAVGVYNFARKNFYTVVEGIAEVALDAATFGVAGAVLQVADALVGATGLDELANDAFDNATLNVQERGQQRSIERLSSGTNLKTQDYDLAFWSQYHVDLGVDKDTVKDFGDFEQGDLEARWHIKQIGGLTDQNFLDDPRVNGALKRVRREAYNLNNQRRDPNLDRKTVTSASDKIDQLTRMSTAVEGHKIDTGLITYKGYIQKYQDRVAEGVSWHGALDQIQDSIGKGTIDQRRAALAGAESAYGNVQIQYKNYEKYIGLYNEGVTLVKSTANEGLDVDDTDLRSAIYKLERNWASSDNHEQIHHRIALQREENENARNLVISHEANMGNLLAERALFNQVQRKVGLLGPGEHHVKKIGAWYRTEPDSATSLKHRREALLDSAMYKARSNIAADPYRVHHLNRQHQQIDGDLDTRLNLKTQLLEKHQG